MGKSATLAFVAAFAAVLSACADDVVAAEAAEMSTAKPHKWLSFNAYADFETALLCRGFVWDTHPFSVQYAEGDIDLDRFGRFSAYTWNMLAWSPVSHSGTWRYRYSEIDYGVRYAYDLELAEEWALNTGVAKMLKDLGATRKALIVLPERDENVVRAAANIPGVKTSYVNTLNVLDILNYDKFIVTQEAVKLVEEVYD